MRVPVASNVVGLAKAGKAHMAKNSDAKSNADAPAGDSFEAQVTVLFPRMKMGASAYAKIQKSAGQTGPEAKNQDDEADEIESQDVFGSLVASVEQKLLKQDEQTVPDSNSVLENKIVTASSLPVAQLMRREKLTDTLQTFKDKSKADAADGNSIVILAASSSAADEIDPSKLVSKASSPIALEDMPQADAVELPQMVTPQATQKPQNSAKSTNVPLAPTVSTAPPDKSSPTMATPSGRDEKSGSGFAHDSAPPRAETATVQNSNVNTVIFPHGGEGKLISPTAQIVENIRAAVVAAPIAVPAKDAVPQPAKTLEIQLRPEGLGMVTVSLKSEQGKLKVEISSELESTRHTLERNSTELVSGLQRVDPAFKGADINFLNQNQETSQDVHGQMSGNGGERRGTPENMSGFGSNGGQDANQANGNTPNSAYGKTRHGQKLADGELPSRVVRADGIYL